jgi:threonyl-tRNA synthetase
MGWKVRQAEREWVPYVIVVGDRERSGDALPIRDRAGRQQVRMSTEELIQTLRAQTRDLPFRPAALPAMLSMRPGFSG